METHKMKTRLKQLCSRKLWHTLQTINWKCFYPSLFSCTICIYLLLEELLKHVHTGLCRQGGTFVVAHMWFFFSLCVEGSASKQPHHCASSAHTTDDDGSETTTRRLWQNPWSRGNTISAIRWSNWPACTLRASLPRFAYTNLRGTSHLHQPLEGARTLLEPLRLLPRSWLAFLPEHSYKEP